MIQQYGLGEEDYRGERFAGWHTQLKGCNDLLCLTRPDLVREIHAEYLQAGSDIVTTDSFNANALSLAGYGLSEHVYEINRAAAALARAAADEFTARNPFKPRFAGGSMGPTSHTLAVGRRGFTRGARGLVRADGRGLPRAGTRSSGRRRRPSDARNLLRHAQRQSGHLCRRNALRRARHAAARRRFGHADPLGAHPLGADGRSLLCLRGPRRAAGREPQLLVRRPGACCPTSNGWPPWPNAAWRSTPMRGCPT